MAVAPPSTALGCGRDIDQVWDHLDQAPDAHELTCPFCQAARADLAPLADATATMRTDEATNPERQPGPHILDRILTIARAEVRRGRRLPLDQPRPGDTTTPNTVSEQAVTAVVRRVGDRTDTVQIRRCTITAEPDPTTTSTDAPTDAMAPGDAAVPGVVRVTLRISIAYDQSIIDVSNELRRTIADVVEQEVGMNVQAVDITVEDIHDA